MVLGNKEIKKKIDEKKKEFYQRFNDFSIINCFFSNLYSNSYVALIFGSEDYTFESSDCGFKYRLETFKGGRVETLEKEFREYKRINHIEKIDEVTLYRTYEKKIWKFWLWREYLYRDVYVNFEYGIPCLENRSRPVT